MGNLCYLVVVVVVYPVEIVSWISEMGDILLSQPSPRVDLILDLQKANWSQSSSGKCQTLWCNGETKPSHLSPCSLGLCVPMMGVCEEELGSWRTQVWWDHISLCALWMNFFYRDLFWSLIRLTPADLTTGAPTPTSSAHLSTSLPNTGFLFAWNVLSPLNWPPLRYPSPLPTLLSLKLCSYHSLHRRWVNTVPKAGLGNPTIPGLGFCPPLQTFTWDFKYLTKIKTGKTLRVVES